MDWLLKEPPRPVQIRALEEAGGRRGWGHFLDMRLGKTRLALAEFLVARKRGAVVRAVVICPNSLKQTWANEAALSGSGLTVNIPDFKTKTWDLAEGDVIAVNYEAIRNKHGEPFAALDALFTKGDVFPGF